MARHQINKKADQQLNALERQLAEAIAAKERAEGKYDLLFQQVFDLFDREVGPGSAPRFICDDAMVLARIIPNMGAIIKEEELLKGLQEHMPPVAAKKFWNRVTDIRRELNQAKLAKELEKEDYLSLIPIVKLCTHIPQRKPTRYRQPANKQEREWLEAGFVGTKEEEATG